VFSETTANIRPSTSQSDWHGLVHLYYHQLVNKYQHLFQTFTN